MWGLTFRPFGEEEEAESSPADSFSGYGQAQPAPWRI